MPIKIFISHSSKDKTFVRTFASDLKLLGHMPWLDEWEIKVGDCIVSKIEQGIADADYVIIVLSKNSVKSGWVETEWKKKYWDEVKSRETKVLPILLEDCEIPTLLQTKKYADFTKSYSSGFLELMYAISPSPSGNELQVSEEVQKRIHSRDKVDIVAVKPYESLETILRLYDKKKQIELIGKELNKSERIGYEFYRVIHPITQKLEVYFLYLYEGTLISRTYDFVATKHPEILKSERLILLFPREKGQSQPEIRKNNLMEIYKPSAAFYIDEFIWKHCTDENFRNDVDNDKFDISHYVDPYLEGLSNETALDYLKRWLRRENEPILVIKGTGGIGKTTLVKKFSNYVYDELSNKKVIFMDSIAIKDDLIKYSAILHHAIDLYDIFKAHNELSEDGYIETLNRELFRLNIDNGNIILIIDGIDEIISALEKKFDLKQFLKSLNHYFGEIGSAKIILTCRNYFWNVDPSEIHFNSIEIMPFNADLAKQYFNSHFSSTKLTQKGLKIANSLMGSSDVDEYIPFVLDIAKHIIALPESDLAKFDDPTFESGLLSISIRIDYLLYRICYRESQKLGLSLDVDSQISFFIKFATKFRSAIKNNDFKQVFDSTFSGSIDIRTVESMKAHPLLVIKDNIVTFRYDFFEEHFQNILFAQLLKGNIDLDDTLLEILVKYTKYNSYSVKNLCERFLEFDETLQIRFVALIEKIASLCQNSITTERIRERSLSSLFIIALRLLQKSASLDRVNTTKLLKDFFNKNGVISNFALIGINRFTSDRIIFDFSDLRFENCYFSDYDYFWECTFNDKTYFERSVFEAVNIKEDYNSTATLNNFNMTTCIVDPSFRQALSKAERDYTSNKYKVIRSLKNFLKTFYIRGNMRPQAETRMKSVYHGKTDDILQKLVAMGVVGEYESERTKKFDRYWQIKEKYREDAINFCLQGTMPTKIKSIIDDMLHTE